MCLLKAVGTLVGGWRRFRCKQSSWKIALWFQLGREEGPGWESAEAKGRSSALFEWVALGWREGGSWSCGCIVGLVYIGEWWLGREMDGSVLNDCQKAASKWCYQDIAIDNKSNKHANLALLAINRNSLSTIIQKWQLKTAVCTGDTRACKVLRRKVFEFDLHTILYAIYRNRTKTANWNPLYDLTRPITHLIQLKRNISFAR